MSSARADAALKTATNLASAWAANEQRQRKRLDELVDALVKGAGLGVSRDELAAALLSTQRRIGVEFPETLWKGLAPEK